MFQRIKKFLSSSYIKSIIILSGGSLLAQIFNFLCSIAMAHLYSKDQIGYFTYILSIVAMFSTVINGRYDVSIVSTENDSDAYALVKISWWICFFSSIIISIAAFFYIVTVQKEYEQYRYLSFWILPLLLIAGLINILNAYNNRFGEYKLISSAYLIRTIIQSILTIVLGLWSAGVLILLLSQFLGQLFGIKRQSKRLMKEFHEIKQVKKDKLIVTMKNYKRQPLFSVPATFVNAVSYSIISLMIGNYYDMEILALYSVSVRVLGLPLSIFSTNVAKVHFKEANSELQNTGKFSKSTRKMTLFSFAIAILMVIILMLFAPNLFSLIYGQSWRIAGVYVRILAPMFAIRMMVGAIGYGFIIANEQKKEAFFQIALLVCGLVLFFIGKQMAWEIEIFLSCLSVCYSFIYFFQLIVIIYLSKREIHPNE